MKKNRRFLIIYGSLVLLSFAVNHPGRLTSDTISMIAQGLRPELLDSWHGVFLPLLWSAFNPLGQPGGALLIQCLLLFLLPALIIDRFLERNASPLKSPGFLLWVLFTFGLIGLAGEILKDVMGGAFLLCLIAGSVLLTNRRPVQLRGALLLIFGAAAFALVRTPNFLVLTFAGCVVLYSAKGLGRHLAVGSVAILLISGGFSVVCENLLFTKLEVRDSFPERSLIIFDVAGISARTGQNHFTELPAMRRAAERSIYFCYGPDRWDRFGFGWCRGYSIAMAEMMAREGKLPLMKWWMRKISEEPVQYVTHRFNHSMKLVVSDWVIAKDPPAAFNKSDNLRPMRSLVVEQGYGSDIAAKIGVWRQRPVLKPFLWIERLFFGNRWMSLASLLICVALLGEQLKKSVTELGDLPIILSCSLGLGNFLMLGVFSVADEARYLLPTALCAASAWVLRLLKAKSPAEPDSTSGALSPGCA